MKKVLLGAAMIVSFMSFSFAQTGTAKTARQTSHKTATTQSAGAQSKTDTKSDVSKSSVTQSQGDQSKTDTKSAASKSSATKSGVAHNGTRLKKDGTPDKRYKANKKA